MDNMQKEKLTECMLLLTGINCSLNHNKYTTELKSDINKIYNLIYQVKTETVMSNPFNEWIYPDSSAIRKYWYDNFKEELHVQWLTGDTIYTFYNVPLKVFKVLNDPDTSKGGYMNYVKMKYSRPYK
jgi:hypothetical protein